MTSIIPVGPPHNLDAERSVLGAILLTGHQTLEPIAHEERLCAEHFYREQHSLVYSAMLALHQRSEPIDTLTVCSQLAGQSLLDDAGGAHQVDELAGWVPAAGHARAYARLVRDHATRRQLLHASYEIQRRVLQCRGDVYDLLADASKRVGYLLEQCQLACRRSTRHSGACEQTSSHPRCPPCAGQERLGQQIATHNALAGRGTLIASLEMCEEEFADRHFAAHVQAPYGKIRAAALSDRDVALARGAERSWR